MLRREIFKLAAGALIPFKPNHSVFIRDDRSFYKSKPEKIVDQVRAKAKMLYDTEEQLLQYKIILVGDKRYYGPDVKQVEYGDTYIKLIAQDIHIISQMTLSHYEIYSHQDEYRMSGPLKDLLCATVGDTINFSYTFNFLT